MSGAAVIEFIERECRVPEGALVGQPIRLRPWQKRIIRGIYDSPTRLAIISFGRKNGKSALSAMLLLAHLVGPKHRINSQLYSAAQSRDQASILFALAAKMVRMSPVLSQYVVVRDTAKQLFCPELGTLYRALSAEASTAYGLSPAFAVHDELGQVKGPRSELYDAIETAAGAQESPLSVIISTQAADAGDLLSMLIDDAQTKADPTTKVWLYTAPDDSDPWSVKTIKLANPAYGDFQNAEEVRRQAAKAKRMPAAESSYRNLILNQRVQSDNPFVSRSVWDDNAAPIDEELFFRGPVYAGLDLSDTEDLTALVMIARDEAGCWHVRPEFFTPKDTLHDRAKRDRAPYDVWRDQGYLIATPGRSVDMAWVADRLARMFEESDVKALSYDRWGMKALRAQMQSIDLDPDQLPLEEFGQGFRDMSPALKLLRADLVNNRIRHGNHPVLRWCAANAIETRDPAGNIKLNKAKSSGRIDGMVALAMAMGRAAQFQTDGPSIYEQRGILTL